jgi:hypothetical protein
MSSYTGFNQTDKKSNNTVTLPYSVVTKVMNDELPPRKVLDYPTPYFVLAIGDGEVGLNQVRGFKLLQLGGKSAVTGDLDVIVYIYNPNFNLNSQQFSYALTNNKYDIIEAFLHSMPTPSQALSTYYAWYSKVKISDGFFDNFNDLFSCLQGQTPASFEEIAKIARAVIFMRYLFPDLSSQILGSNFSFNLTYDYYADYLNALNQVSGVCPPMNKATLLSLVTQIVDQVLSTVTSGVSTITSGVSTAVSGITSTLLTLINQIPSTPSLITTVLQDMLNTDDFSQLGCALTNFLTGLYNLAQQGNLGEMQSLSQSVQSLLNQVPGNPQIKVCNNGTCYITTPTSVATALSNLVVSLGGIVTSIVSQLTGLVFNLLTGFGTITNEPSPCGGSSTSSSESSTSSSGGLLGDLL